MIGTILPDNSIQIYYNEYNKEKTLLKEEIKKQLEILYKQDSITLQGRKKRKRDAQKKDWWPRCPVLLRDFRTSILGSWRAARSVGVDIVILQTFQYRPGAGEIRSIPEPDIDAHAMCFFNLLLY